MPGLQEKVGFLADEMAIVGQYIRSMSMGEDLQITSLDDDMPNSYKIVHTSGSASGDLGSPPDAGDQTRIYYPISIEGRNILIEQVAIRNASHFRTVKHQVD